jgi:hypothetical protein
MQRSTYVGSDRAVLARIAEQQKADATAAYLRARTLSCSLALLRCCCGCCAARCCALGAGCCVRARCGARAAR